MAGLRRQTLWQFLMGLQIWFHTVAIRDSKIAFCSTLIVGAVDVPWNLEVNKRIFYFMIWFSFSPALRTQHTYKHVCTWTHTHGIMSFSIMERRIHRFRNGWLIMLWSLLRVCHTVFACFKWCYMVFALKTWK